MFLLSLAVTMIVCIEVGIGKLAALANLLRVIYKVCGSAVGVR